MERRDFLKWSGLLTIAKFLGVKIQCQHSPKWAGEGENTIYIIAEDGSEYIASWCDGDTPLVDRES